MKPSVEIVEPKLFAGAVADEIVACAQDAIQERGRFSLVLAGGSTPGEIYRTLTIPPRVTDIDWKCVDLFFGDERWVPVSDNQSNQKMVRETLLAHLTVELPRVHGIDTSLPSPRDSAIRYDHALRAAGYAPNGTAQFDLVLLGMGEDGHTASLFPHSPLLSDKGASLCEAVSHPDGSDRITLTPAALLNARKVVFLIKGENKAATVRRVLEGDEPVAELPARLFVANPERIAWFLDSGAALQLSHR